jgi:hypothetical protein
MSSITIKRSRKTSRRKRASFLIGPWGSFPKAVAQLDCLKRHNCDFRKEPPRAVSFSRSNAMVSYCESLPMKLREACFAHLIILRSVVPQVRCHGLLEARSAPLAEHQCAFASSEHLPGFPPSLM